MIGQLFAVERYDDSGGTRAREPFPALPSGTRLACAVYLPDDDVEVAFVEGADAESVRAAVVGAGWRVDRITAGSWLAQPSGEVPA